MNNMRVKQPKRKKMKGTKINKKKDEKVEILVIKENNRI